MLPADLLEQVNAAILDPDGPGAVLVHRWLVDEHDALLTFGQIHYYFAKVRRDGAVAR